MTILPLAFRWLSLSAILLSGCVQPELSPGNTEPSQVIVRVNGEEISVLQYRRAVRLARVSNPSKIVQREIVEKLVDRELAVQQALEQQLDRQPDVLIELEEARRDVLARAWAEDLARTVSDPDDNAAAGYYGAHPYLFSERRIYHLREATLGNDRAGYAEALERLTRGEALDDVLAWLKEEDVILQAQVVVRTAEQLPIAALPRLSTTSPGKPAYFETPRGLLIYEVVESRAAPLDWDAARPVILSHLDKQAGKKAVLSEKQRLRRNADIRYSTDVIDSPLTPEQTNQ